MSDTALTALALIERILLEDGKGVQELAQGTPPEEVGAILTQMSVIFAAHLFGERGTTAALELVDGWRNTYLKAQQS